MTVSKPQAPRSADLASADERVDLVVSDVVMPVVGGAQLRELLARNHSELPVIWSRAIPGTP